MEQTAAQLASLAVAPEENKGAADAQAATNNPEEEKKSIYHGMRNVANKNTIINLESKK